MEKRISNYAVRNAGIGNITITAVNGKWVKGIFLATGYSKGGMKPKLQMGDLKRRWIMRFEI